jgi:hypothetical protein
MHIKKNASVMFATVCLAALLGCHIWEKEDYKLIRWGDGTNDCYAIEISHEKKGSDVVIPDVWAFQTNSQFISGNAYWKHVNGFYSTPDGSLNTNEFWFVLDKRKPYPKCYATVSTNKQSWVSWCLSHNAPTNIVDITEFISVRTSRGGGGAPSL